MGCGADSALVECLFLTVSLVGAQDALFTSSNLKGRAAESSRGQQTSANLRTTTHTIKLASSTCECSNTQRVLGQQIHSCTEALDTIVLNPFRNATKHKPVPRFNIVSTCGAQRVVYVARLCLVLVLCFASVQTGLSDRPRKDCEACLHGCMLMV